MTTQDSKIKISMAFFRKSLLKIKDIKPELCFFLLFVLFSAFHISYQILLFVYGCIAAEQIIKKQSRFPAEIKTPEIQYPTVGTMFRQMVSYTDLTE